MRDRCGSHSRAGNFFATISLTFAIVLCPLAAWAQPLQEQVQALIAKRDLGQSGVVGVCLMDAGTRTVLASVRGDEPMTPASNMKLLTSAGAMWTLGEDFAFRTSIVLEGDRLVIVGGGDPALGDPEVLRRGEPSLTVDDLLTRLGEAVVKAVGPDREIGEIVIDDRVFDRTYVHPTWKPENLHLAYSAPVGGLNFHANVVSVFARPNPDGPGRSPLASVQPASRLIRVDTSRAKTVAQGNNSVWLARGDSLASFVMRGDVRVASKVPAQVTIPDPSMWTGLVLADAFERAGVRLRSGDVATSIRLAQPMERLPDGVTAGRVVAVVSTPLDEVLRRCNVDSENLYAESMLKRMGHEVTKEPGDWTNGATVLRMLLGEKVSAQAAASTTITDGSGLSRDNKVSAQTLARWLVAAHREPWGKDFLSSLATPGEGTLEKRFRGRKLKGEVYAKSGYIHQVRTLSGYVVDKASGRTLVFSVLVNGLPVASSEPHNQARLLHEEIVQLLDEELSGVSSRAGR